MLPFGEASLKQNKKMKTYITPNTEYQDILRGRVLCGSVNDGKAQMSDAGHTPSSPAQGMPRKVF